ncbi:unnamed protein product [Alopecurus aequalis]
MAAPDGVAGSRCRCSPHATNLGEGVVASRRAGIGLTRRNRQPLVPKGAPERAGGSCTPCSDTDMAWKLENASSLTIRALQELTDDFSEQRKIGQGAYGKVYVAKLGDGEEIAVKVLYDNMPGIDDEQFLREFENLMRLEHQNIVRLLAYCYETHHRPMQHEGKTVFAERIHRALCFEYMENGSLEAHITDECAGLDWLTRYNIIKGTCNGLKHLHEGSGQPVYHLDLKPDNILLDKNMVPKLADFGLSRLLCDIQTVTTHGPIGTIGYLPQEFLHENIISNKLDIFSLGVVMIKILGGHGRYSRSAEMPRQDFLDLVNANWRKRMETCGDPRLLEAYCEQINSCIEIALSCMEIDRHRRPNIADIVHALDDTEAAIDLALSWRESRQPLITDEDSVKVEAFTRSEVIPYAESEDEYPILVRVTAPAWRHAVPRPGVDLVLVLDWFFIENREDALLELSKQGMLMVIDRLRSDDRLSIVSGNGVCIMELTLMSEKERHVARLMVDGLVLPKYGCLAARLREGVKVLRGRELDESESRLGIILTLFCHFCTKSDTLWDPTDDLEAALDVFIGGITKVAATCIRITLTAHQGIAISSIESGRYRSRVSSGCGSGEIDINDMYAGETKNFVVKLKLSEGKGKLVTIGGHYLSLGERKNLTDTDVFVMRLGYGCCSPRKLAVHPEVAAELVRVQLLKGLPAILERSNGYIIEGLLVELWDKIMSSEEGRHVPEETMEGLVKEKMEMTATMHRNSMDLPRKYVMAWLSSHEWQRATTKGTRSRSVLSCRKC